MKKIFYQFLLVIIFFCGNLVLGKNITKEVLLFNDEVFINGGKSFSLVAAPQGERAWASRRPQAAKEEVFIYLPWENGVKISNVRANSRFEQPLNVEMWSFDGKEWIFNANSSSLNFSFKEPIKAYALKFVCSGMGGKRDHEVFVFYNWQVIGETQGDRLPIGDFMQLTCNQKDNTFDLPNAAEATCTVLNPTKKEQSFVAKINYKNFQGDKIASSEEMTFSLEPNKTKVLDLKFQSQKQTPLVIEVYLYSKENYQLLGLEAILLGVRDKDLAYGSKVAEAFISTGRKENKAAFKPNSTIWCADTSHGNISRGRRPHSRFFENLNRGGSEVLMAITKYSSFEPLPGVYNFDEIDYLIEEASKQNIGLELGLWWWDFGGPSQFWLKDDAFNYGKDYQGWKGTLSPFSTRVVNAQKRAVELMLQRYKDCPEIAVWVPHPYGAVDHDTLGVFDFHPEAISKYQAYLQEKYSSIDKLNKAYKTNYKEFKEIAFPARPYLKAHEKGAYFDALTQVSMDSEWEDYLNFYHDAIRKIRNDMAELVRTYDKTREISGMNASGGVGHADKVFEDLVKNNAFYGDQGLNLIHYVRRFAAKYQYGLKLRHEDIQPVTVGRNGFNKENIIDRIDWDMFQICMIGVDHFNYVFTAYTDSPFWDRLFSNGEAKKMAKEANSLKLKFNDIGYLHSFNTDVRVGNYYYQGISVFRWKTMNALSKIMIKSPENMFNIFSEGGPLDKLKELKLVFDDGSQVMTANAVKSLVQYVQNGGNLMLLNITGEYTLDHLQESYKLLRELGYTDIDTLSKREKLTAKLNFDNGNSIFVHNFSTLEPPKGGKVLGYINGKVGAVSWKFGKGEVTLIGGVIGENDEITLAELSKDNKQLQEKMKNISNSADDRLISQWEILLKNVDIKKPYEFSCDGIFSAMRYNDNKFIIYTYAQKDIVKPILTLNEFNGSVKVTVKTLDKIYDTFEVSANNIILPNMSKNRFMAIEIEK